MIGAHARPRRRCWFAAALLLVALWLTNVSRTGVPIRGGRDSSTPSAPGSPTLRVLTLNVLHGFPRFEDLDARLSLISNGLLLEQPDIVCLQEAGWTLVYGNVAAHLAEEAGYEYVYARANGNRWAISFEEGEAILTRYPVGQTSVVELLPRAGWFEHRVALSAVIETPLGDLRVISTHLTHGDSGINAQQAAALAALVSESEYPTIVCGDLNATEGSPQMAFLTESMVDAYREVNRDDAAPTCCIGDLTDPDLTFSKRIDYVLIARRTMGSLRPAAARTILDQPVAVEGGALWPSDHSGVLVDFARRD